MQSCGNRATGSHHATVVVRAGRRGSQLRGCACSALGLWKRLGANVFLGPGARALTEAWRRSVSARTFYSKEVGLSFWEELPTVVGDVGLRKKTVRAALAPRGARLFPMQNSVPTPPPCTDSESDLIPFASSSAGAPVPGAFLVPEFALAFPWGGASTSPAYLCPSGPPVSSGFARVPEAPTVL